MEGWDVPLIKASLEFLYEKATGLVREILDRRKESKTSHGGTESNKDLEKLAKDLASVSKEMLLKKRVDEARLEKRSEQIEHLVKLADIYTKNYTNAREKLAMWGPGLTPPIVIHELEDSERNLLEVIDRIHGHINETFVERE